MDIKEYQTRAHQTSQSADMDVFVYGIIGEAGDLASAIKQFKRGDSSKEVLRLRIEEEIGDLCWYVAEVATRHDIDLAASLQRNLTKTQELFTNRDTPFDTSVDPTERFPEKGTFEFRLVDGKVNLTLDGKPVGNKLDSNSHEEDEYRFHDIFHITLMVKLDWSPTLRKLLKCKRKAGAGVDTDRVEDGARSLFLEEGISALVFGQNVRLDGRSLFSEKGNIPFPLLQNIKTITQWLEVRVRSVNAWKEAIATAFYLFDLLATNQGGAIVFDKATKSLRYEPLSK